MTLLERLAEYEREYEFLRQYTIPEEDRHLFTSMKWGGEYRWFRSDNIVCLEKVRVVVDWPASLEHRRPV
jgi:hypothetical protein